MPKKLSSLL